MDLTVRKAIEEMRKVGSNCITCNNKTKIYIMEINSMRIDQPIGRFKWNTDGSIKVIRKFFISIKDNYRTIWKEFQKEDKNHWLYDPDDKDEDGYDNNFFHESEYLLDEREMNGFISDNGGIDHYVSIGQYAYMLSDCMSMMDEE